jgi:DNA mismatch endonuclease (patch repair protein)
LKDKLTKERRSWNMSRIKGKNTKPEILVRSLLHKLGYRFRLHGKKLPGKPDVVLPKYKTVIFIHGCFRPVAFSAAKARSAFLALRGTLVRF